MLKIIVKMKTMNREMGSKGMLCAEYAKYKNTAISKIISVHIFILYDHAFR